MRTTPNNITKLEPNEVFVFGSNLAGRHGKGAALTAFKHFGAVQGQGHGLQGSSYAIPTKDEGLRTLPLIYIGNRVCQFCIFAHQRQDLTFLVTQIGCGLSGYKPEQIAPLFFVNPISKNVVLPEEFWYCMGHKQTE